MPVVVKLQPFGTYKKLRDKTAELDVQPRLLNERRRYGKLEEPDQMDLTKGLETFRDEGFGDCFFSFFDYIKKTTPPGTPLKKAIGSDFVSNRRNLTNFAESAYLTARKFEIRAIRKDGIIFLCDKESQSLEEMNWAYGFKFEQYMTLNENGLPHDEDEPVSNAECIRAVLRTTLESEGKEMKVFYSAEMDAKDRRGNLVEFKKINNGYENWIKYNSLRDYLQSSLGGISYTVKGITIKNVVVKMDKIIVDKIPDMVQTWHAANGQKAVEKKRIKWNSEKCFEKLFAILEKIKTRLQNDDEAIIIRNDGENIHYEEENANNCNFVDPEFLRYFH